MFIEITKYLTIWRKRDESVPNHLAELYYNDTQQREKLYVDYNDLIKQIGTIIDNIQLPADIIHNIQLDNKETTVIVNKLKLLDWSKTLREY